MTEARSRGRKTYTRLRTLLSSDKDISDHHSWHHPVFHFSTSMSGRNTVSKPSSGRKAQMWNTKLML